MLGYLGFRGRVLPGEDSIVLLLVVFVSHPVQAELSPLSEGFSAPINPTSVRSLISVNVLVLLLVLLQSKLLAAESARKLLLFGVGDGVPLQGKFGAVLFVASWVGAHKLFARFIVLHL